MVAEHWPPAFLPALTFLVAAMVYAGLRICQSAYVLVRDGIFQWQGRKVLGALQDEVDRGLRTPFELFLQYGIHHLQLKDPHRARTFFEAAIAAHPLSPHGHYGQGLAHRESMYYPGRLQEEALLRTLERDDLHQDARLLLVEFYMQSGLYRQAHREYQKLPPSRHSETLQLLMGRPEPSPLDGHAVHWSRVSVRDRWLLALMDCVCMALAVGAIFVPQVLVFALYFLALIPFHALLFWRLSADGEGFSFQSLRARLTCRWNDLLDLVEVPSGGFYLHTADRSYFVSRGWSQYGELLIHLKHHLYQRGWVPMLKHYDRVRWHRSLVS